MVIKFWNKGVTGRFFLDKWQNRARNVRRNLRGWNLKFTAQNKKDSKMLPKGIEKIDRESEHVSLTANNYMLRQYLEERLHRIIKEEEVKWVQRAKENDLLFGNAPTSYFMAKANGRRRKE